MNIIYRIWSPDTCDCRVAMQMSGETQTDFVPIKSFVNKEGIETVTNFCSKHSKDNMQESFDACQKTNTTKNLLEGVFNSLSFTKRTLSQSEIDTLKLLAVAQGKATSFESALVDAEIRSKDFKWSVTQNGEVEIDLGALTEDEKADLVAEISKKLTNVVIK